MLRPGGRVALLDTDWATTILHPGAPETVAALTSGALSAAADPYSGRKRGSRLTAAGLVIDDRRALVAEAQRDHPYADLTEAAAQGALHLSVVRRRRAPPVACGEH